MRSVGHGGGRRLRLMGGERRFDLHPMGGPSGPNLRAVGFSDHTGMHILGFATVVKLLHVVALLVGVPSSLHCNKLGMLGVSSDSHSRMCCIRSNCDHRVCIICVNSEHSLRDLGRSGLYFLRFLESNLSYFLSFERQWRNFISAD
jgi:hypothetical protein